MPTHAEQVDAVRRLVRESVQAVDALVPPAMRAVVPALVQARDELRSDLQDWLATAKNGADRFTAVDKQAALRALEGALDRIKDLHPAMASALAGQRHATGPLAISNLDNEIRRLSAIFGGGVPVIPNIKAAAIIAQGDKLLWKRHETSAKRYAGAIGEDIKHLLAVGVAKGESFDQLVNRLRRIGSAGRTARPIEPGADSAEIAGGLFGRYRWWAERLVRTEGMNTYNVMHDESIAYANENRPDGDEEYLRRWDASMDARVCPICYGLDGKVATLGGTFPGGYSSPPAHPACRCVCLAWLRRWGNMKGETQINGPVPTPGPARGKPVTEEPQAAPPPAKPKRVPKSPPPVPEMAPVPELQGPARDVMQALERGDHAAAVRHIDQAMRDRGLVPSSSPNTGKVTVSDDGLRVRSHSGVELDARALHTWGGDIQLSKAVEKEIAKYAAAASAYQPLALHVALDEHAEALYQHRQKVKNKKHRDQIPTGDEQYKRIGGLYKGNAAGVKTLVHEALHGFSPLEAAAYRGAAGQIEEITTEVMARVIARDEFMMAITGAAEGSYAYDIEAATSAIAELTGGSQADAYDQLQVAAERFKRRPWKLHDERAVMEAFAEEVATVTRTGDRKAREVISRHLAGAAQRTASAAGAP